MRDYLYLWRNHAAGSLIASGIEFRDLLPVLTDRDGLCLLHHAFDGAQHCLTSHIDHVASDQLALLARDDIHSYGTFAWADYTGSRGPTIEPRDLAALLYFAHVGKPLGPIRLPSVDNHFLAYAHDDGWFLRLYHAEWAPVEALLATLLDGMLPPQLARQTLRDLSSMPQALWITHGTVATCQQTLDIDGILNQRLKR